MNGIFNIKSNSFIDARRRQKLNTVQFSRSHSEFLETKRQKDNLRHSRQFENLKREKQELQNMKYRIYEKERMGEERVTKSYKSPKTVSNEFKGNLLELLEKD